MDKKYKHKEWEPKIYSMWEEKGVFSPEKSIEMREEVGYSIKKDSEGKNETYTVLIPPPNANAPLHCGHATYAIQDLMVRFKRMQGYKSLYLPGMDHAGFETQVVYERHLKKQGKSRFDYDRETLYKEILDFVLENSDVATNQLKKMGMGCDWDRTTFMLDNHVIKMVFDTFEKMHKDGLIYKDDYLVNYSPTHGTTFSNLETEWVEQVDPLYYMKYGPFTLATVRPETKFGDTAVAVHPEDKRYQKWIGKEIEVEGLTGTFKLKVIADDYVDPEFGTGVVKVTPAHDPNDFEAGKRHGLEMKSVIGLDGKLNELCGEYAGMRVKAARKIVVEDLQAKGLIVKIDENYKHNVLVDYKDKKPIEPMLLPNWFIKMTDKKINLAGMAIDAIENEDIKYNRELWKNETLRWLNNIRDWPISRQTVFGIRIPVWYKVEGWEDKLFALFLDKDGSSHEGMLQEHFDAGYSLDDIVSGLQKLISPKNAEYVISRESPGDGYIQETDTFDTWFSSGQWPFTTLHYPDGDDYKEFFPTQFMDSMWDIIFFWIARMLMFSLYLTKDDKNGAKVPFENVYIHGRIDDEKGQKMSKSKGNVIDPLEYVEMYGADALRMGMLVGGNSAGRTTSFSADKVRGYRNFSNKVWNMGRFVILMLNQYKEETGESVPFLKHCICKESCTCNEWMDTDDLNELDIYVLKEYETLVENVTENLDKFRFMDAGDAIYHFVWHEIADKYIEDVKNRDSSQRKKVGLSILRHVFLNSLKLLHPFMPFVTEAVWEQLPKKYDYPLAIAEWPRA